MITVIGSVNLDLITTVERLPNPGETVSGSNFHTAPGGKGANQALAAARAGSAVRMVGAVGQDAFADEALSLLQQAELDLSHISRNPGATGTALIMVDCKGENAIAVAPGANFTVNIAQIPPLDPESVLLLQHEIPLETIEAAMDAAHQSGARTILNAAPARPDAAKLLAKADYVVANETEFDLYADLLGLEGESREARMANFVARTGRVMIVTLGGDGAIAQTLQGAFRVPSIQIIPIDTVGAGDTFCGYLAAGLHEGLDLETALQRASIAGALACLKPGAQPSIPTAAEVDARANSGV